jgi:hypothetical protein
LIDALLLVRQLQHQTRQICSIQISRYLQNYFTEQETKYFSNENTRVVDHLVGLYGKELELNKD